jgi:hypothetical protein
MPRKYKITLEITEEVTVLKGKEKGRKVEAQVGMSLLNDIFDKKGLYDVLDNILPDMEKQLDKGIKDFEEGKIKVDVKPKYKNK